MPVRLANACSQSHHTGIEIDLTTREAQDLIALNRTTLELKSWRQVNEYQGNPPLNRTTLELKFKAYRLEVLGSHLSIAPHWN